MPSTTFIFYEISTLIYITLIYFNTNSFIYTLPIIGHLIYRHSKYDIPHLDIMIIIYGMMISYYNAYLIIPFIINTSLLFIYSIDNIHHQIQ